ncbi:helix-turn-helix transcriptional regulator [Deinococcus sp. KSM4-11]|uniref:helix-turn-helix domain-containing protein n=1 Tax=Deinococcus sp. KSM4-11 TaxID=2568654 RepID=UPI0010A50408|nr:helix-turn-helix domain-containing protein [Deinococcus sp. KSM4-11]THF88431.1 helix-turn-helix transcriptional regulator [Deinococcus sp. KSM4-11]
MATNDAERLSSEFERAVKHGRLIRERRLDLGLKRPAFVSEVAKHGQDMSPDYLNKIEAGTRALANASPELREAIRAVLGYSREQWQELTGLYSPSPTAPATTYTGGSPIPPVVPHRDLPIEIPRELQEVIDQYGETYPELHTPTMQRILIAPRNYGGPANGPQTAEQWFEYFLLTRRYTRA